MTEELTGDVLTEVNADTTKLLQSIIPYLAGDENKARYLGFRASGFTIREALKLVDVTDRTLRNWRQADPDFRHLEDDLLPELRTQAKKEIISLEFIRNYRLVLLKDYQVLQKSVTEPDQLTTSEHQYLLKARQHYTPQQLAILEQLFGGDGVATPGTPQSFSEFVLTLKRTVTEEVIMPVGSINAP